MTPGEARDHLIGTGVMDTPRLSVNHVTGVIREHDD